MRMGRAKNRCAECQDQAVSRVFVFFAGIFIFTDSQHSLQAAVNQSGAARVKTKFCVRKMNDALSADKRLVFDARCLPCI